MFIFSLIYIAATIISIVWIFLGIPIGIILAVIAATNENTIKRSIYFRRALISFGGIPALMLVFLIFFIINFILSFFGTSLSLQLPIIK